MGLVSWIRDDILSRLVTIIKRLNFSFTCIIIKYGNYHGRLIGKALNGLHSNVLLGQLTISNTRSKRVNENIATICTQPIKSQYMQIFMFVSVSVSIIMHCLY